MFVEYIHPGLTSPPLSPTTLPYSWPHKKLCRWTELPCDYDGPHTVPQRNLRVDLAAVRRPRHTCGCGTWWVRCTWGNAPRGWSRGSARLPAPRRTRSTATAAYVFIQSQLLVVECGDTLNVNSTFTPRHYRLSVTISCDVFTLINCYSVFPATAVLLFLSL